MDKKTILVVDDKSSIRQVTEMFIANIDIGSYETITCENSKLAIPHISKADLLITDFDMPPGMNGAELTKIAKREKPDMPVIIMTGDPGDIPADHLADKVLEKPFEFEQLKEVIADLLRR